MISIGGYMIFSPSALVTVMIGSYMILCDQATVNEISHAFQAIQPRLLEAERSAGKWSSESLGSKTCFRF
jgi:hypothetical protein